MRVTSAIVAALLALAPSAAGEPEDLTPERRKEVEKRAADLHTEGERLYAAGDYAKARASFREALAMYRALYPKERYPQGHANLATCINNLAVAHKVAGEYGQAEPLYREALGMRRAIYPKDQYPQGHPDLVSSINNLARLHRATGEYGQAEPLYREALDLCRALYPRDRYPQGHPDLAAGISGLAQLHQVRGEYGKAEPFFREAMDMYRALYPRDKYPQGHTLLVLGINNLAALYVAAGDYAKAREPFGEALDMCRGLYPRDKYPQGHPDLAISIANLAGMHRAVGEYGQAEPLLKEALAMRRALYPKDRYPRGHPDLVLSINNLAALHQVTGEYVKAEPLFKEALAMSRTLFPRETYPRGHPALAMGVNNLAEMYRAAGEYGRAEPLFKEALAMHRALHPRDKYPRGHPDLAVSLNNLAMLYRDAGESGKAESLYQEALAMKRALYPKDQYPRGHPAIAAGINNLAMLYHEVGEYGRAEPLLKEALAMYRALYSRDDYPLGHEDIVLGTRNLAWLHQARGEYGQAEPLLREAVGVSQGLLRRYAELAAEAEGLNYLATQGTTRDALLSVTRPPRADVPVYDALWDGRAALTRLQERRHRDLMASRDPDTADLAHQLRLARGDLARRLLRPDRDADKQRLAVRQLTDAKEDLEKRIAQRLKLAALLPVTTPPLKWLVEALPADAAFVDFYRYTDFAQDPAVKGDKGEKRTPRYVAFVVRHGRDVARVELGEAAPIERAWARWRQALTAARPEEQAESQAAAALAKLVWEPLRKELPPTLRTLYLTPDGVLHQVPWAALPGRQPGTVLLEEHALCLVPHGPFLLERLEDHRPPAAPTGTLLAVGGVAYDGAPETGPARPPGEALRGPAGAEKGLRWPALPGTEQERRQVVVLARQAAHLAVLERSGKAAGTEQLQRDLPTARYAHIATHGFFADPKFRSALHIDPNEFEGPSKDRRGGARSPLALSGLVFAGANRTGEAMAEDRGILTAEGLIALRLEGLELAVLSACETGLGAWGGDEGVYGLQRAFHVAGCGGVVASLWKVDDGATQALMALFYRNLWERKLDPAEALRRAQLTLYRHPEAVGVAARRGADFSESDLPKVEDRPAERSRRSPAAHWAAFTFSGVRPIPHGE
jgi:CHAT domain-containing protein